MLFLCFSVFLDNTHCDGSQHCSRERSAPQARWNRSALVTRAKVIALHQFFSWTSSPRKGCATSPCASFSILGARNIIVFCASIILHEHAHLCIDGFTGRKRMFRQFTAQLERRRWRQQEDGGSRWPWDQPWPRAKNVFSRARLFQV